MWNLGRHEGVRPGLRIYDLNLMDVVIRIQTNVGFRAKSLGVRV